MDKKIGILGGGQLGKMMVQAASKMDLDLHIMDKNADFPAAKWCANFHLGDFRNFDDVMRFGRTVDILSIEIEGVNVAALKELQTNGHEVYPDPQILELIVDKGLQKQWVHSMGLPTSEYRLLESSAQIQDYMAEGKIQIPFVQKLRKGGYDGRAVQIIHKKDDEKDMLHGPSLVEKKIDIRMEISVIAARNQSGEIRTFPATEMSFVEEANLLDFQICPARISPAIQVEAIRMAEHLMQSSNYIGLMAIEMFLDHEDKLWINELAPRPHNSGHHTIEACLTSQYEQHLRAILDFPLGSTQLLRSSILVNLLGSPGYEGKAIFQGIKKCLSREGIYLHIYGKQETRPFRKMGHATVIDDDLEAAFEKANFVKEHLKIIA